MCIGCDGLQLGPRPSSVWVLKNCLCVVADPNFVPGTVSPPARPGLSQMSASSRSVGALSKDFGTYSRFISQNFALYSGSCVALLWPCMFAHKFLKNTLSLRARVECDRCAFQWSGVASLLLVVKKANR